MGLHVFPIPIPPPTSLSTRPLWVFPVHQVRALVSCTPPGLVIWTNKYCNCSVLISNTTDISKQTSNFYLIIVKESWPQSLRIRCLTIFQLFLSHTQISLKVLWMFGFAGGTVVKNHQWVQEMQEIRLDPSVGRIPWRRKWQPTPVFLPGESHGQGSLAGYSPWGHKELDTTECTFTATEFLVAFYHYAFS